jgi:hypothetical protein
MSAIILLSPLEIQIACMAGVDRQLRKIGLPGIAGVDQKSYGWQMHCDGAIGEMVLAKHLNIYWAGGDTKPNPVDVGPYQVRSTAKMESRMAVRPKDKDSDVFVFVRAHRAPIYEIIGWITGAEAKWDQWKGNPGTNREPAWFVPDEALHPMEELPERKELYG